MLHRYHDPATRATFTLAIGDVLTEPQLDLCDSINRLVENNYRTLHRVSDYAARMNKSPKTTTVELRGHPAPEDVDALLAAGYTKANVIDVVVTIGDKVITNFLHAITQVPIDFPLAPALETAPV